MSHLTELVEACDQEAHEFTHTHTRLRPPTHMAQVSHLTELVEARDQEAREREQYLLDMVLEMADDRQTPSPTSENFPTNNQVRAGECASATGVWNYGSQHTDTHTHTHNYQMQQHPRPKPGAGAVGGRRRHVTGGGGM